MKIIYGILICSIFSSFSVLNAQNIVFATTDNQNIVETFVKKENGLTYNFESPDRETRVDVINDVKGKLLSYSHTDLKKNITTNYSIDNGYLVGKREHKGKVKTWKKNLKGLPMILFPEIEFKEFAKNSEKKEISYVSMRFDNQKTFVTKADCEPYGKESPEGTFAETAITITFRYVSKNIAYFIYFFDKNGIAVQKNMYILNPKIPKIVLWPKE